jgi:hypothetical protein
MERKEADAHLLVFFVFVSLIMLATSSIEAKERKIKRKVSAFRALTQKRKGNMDNDRK